MTAKEYLDQYRILDEDINCKLGQVAELRAMAEKTSPSSASSNSGTSDRVGKTVAKIVDLEIEINDKIDELLKFRNEIQFQIAAIGDPVYKLILEERYINGYSFERISRHLNYSRVHVCRLHGKALLLINPPDE